MFRWRTQKQEAQPGLSLEGDVDGLRRGRVGGSAVEVGRFTYGVETLTIREWGEGAALRLGGFCSVAAGSTVFLGGNHRVDWATTYPFGHIFPDDLGSVEISGHPQSRGDVVIGNDVWIGEGVTILSGVTIGDGAVIGATSTVTRSVGSYEVWAGNPARRVRLRFEPEIVRGLQALSWWECEVSVIRRMAPLLSQVPDLTILAELEAIRTEVR